MRDMSTALVGRARRGHRGLAAIVCARLLGDEGKSQVCAAHPADVGSAPCRAQRTGTLSVLYFGPTEITMPHFATISPIDVAPLRLLTLRLARRLRKHAGTGLSPSQQSALTTLERRGPMRVGELARREHISKSSVTRLVARLEQLALVERRKDERDGRSWCVELTDRGSELLASSSRRADAYLARQVAILAPDDQRRLLDALPVLERLLDAKA